MASDAAQASAESRSSSPDPDQEDEINPPFFNTTYAVYRTSPLFIGSKALNKARLGQLARRFRETLVGDAIRGIQIGIEATETTGGQVGPLKAVHIKWFQANAVLGDQVSLGKRKRGGASTSDWDDMPERQKQGLWIEIRHETASYLAVLLPGYSANTNKDAKTPGWAMRPGDTQDSADSDNDQFLHLPLLLLRMPQPLQLVVCDWLGATFDCHASRATLGTKTIVGSWEQWLQIAGLPTKGPNITIVLGFNAPLAEKDTETVADSEDEDDGLGKAGLDSIAVTVSAQDIRRFVRAGKIPAKRAGSQTWEQDPRERRRLAGPNTDEGWIWRRDGGDQHPFTEALGQYLKEHMALDLFHPSVRVEQISCGGFALGQSRVKLVKNGELSDDLSRAAWMFVTFLGDRVRGDKMPAVF